MASWNRKRKLGKIFKNLNKVCTLIIMYQYWFINFDTGIVLMLIVGDVNSERNWV